MTIRRRIQQEDGQMLALMPAIFLVMLGLSGLVVDVGNGYLTQHRLQTALDAGALIATQDLANGQSTALAVADANRMVSANGFPNITFDPANQTGTNQMTITTSPTDKVSLTSKVAVPTFFMKVFSMQTINVKVSSASAAEPSPVFDYALFANKSLDINTNNLDVTGSVHSNGSLSWPSANNINISDNAEVHGSYDDSSVNHESYGGHFESSAPVIPMPQFDINQYKAMAEANGTVYNGDLTDTQDNNLTLNNIVFVNGNVDIEVNNLYCNTIIATGTIKIYVNNVTQSNTSQSLLSICSNQDIDIHDNNSKDLKGFVYAPNGQVNIQGNNLQGVEGSIVAQTITLNQNNIGVTYDSGVQSLVPKKAVLVTG